MLASFDDEEKRTVIKMCIGLDQTPREIIKTLQGATRQESISRLLTYKWHKRFLEGWETSTADERCSRPTAATKTTVSAVKKLVLKDCRIIFRDICEQMDMSDGSVYNILSKNLEDDKGVCTLDND